MKKHKILVVLLTIFQFVALVTRAQITDDLTDGEISYITGRNVYVRFESTLEIESGDTLFISRNENLVPALVVTNLSSISCLCEPLEGFEFNIEDRIFARTEDGEVDEIGLDREEDLPEKDVSEEVLTTEDPVDETEDYVQDISGRISLSSYSSFSGPDYDDLHRFRYTLSMDAANFSDSKLSAESYISFTHKLNQWDVVQENLNNALKIYNLALKYEFDKATWLLAGRKINPKIANVGAIDGIQFQKEWKSFFVGAAAGWRPDFLDYGFNSKLPEFGAYFGHSANNENGNIQSTIGFFEQRNNSKTDRRFVYLQHTNSAIKNLTIFSSVEIDLYKVENDQPQNALTLTSLYFSARYRFTRRLSIFGSYDNRKDVIYYEIFRNYSEEVLQQASRQGLRFRINYRPINYLILNVNAGTRFRKEEPRPTKTLNGIITYGRVPGIDASFSVSSNLMQTAYLDGKLFGGRLTKDIIPGKISTMLLYRNVDFSYVNTGSKLRQNIGEIDLSYYVSENWHFSVNFEATFQKENNQGRLYLNLRRKL